jgi:hypothetical protein
MTRKEAKEEGIEVLTRKKAINFMVKELSESLAHDTEAIRDIVKNGYNGVNSMTDEDIEDFFECWDDDYILEWKLEA